MPEELKPCPFCGNSGNKDPRHSYFQLGPFCHVQCGACSAIGPAVRPATNEHQALSEWNRRTPDAQPEPAATPPRAALTTEEIFRLITEHRVLGLKGDADILWLFARAVIAADRGQG